MTFGERSRYLRKEKELSQIELARALNISKACISMIEIGKNIPTAVTLERYADFFGCSTDYLLGREDDFGIISLKNEAPALSTKAQELVDIFNALDSMHQVQILEYARYFAECSRKKSKKS